MDIKEVLGGKTTVHGQEVRNTKFALGIIKSKSKESLQLWIYLPQYRIKSESLVFFLEKVMVV